MVVYQPHGLVKVWATDFATALEAIGSICGCSVHRRPHGVHRPKDVHSPYSDLVGLEPDRYYWVLAAAKGTSSDAPFEEDWVSNVEVATHNSRTWTGAICGKVLKAEIIEAPTFLLQTSPVVHLVDASIIGAKLRRAQESMYGGIKGPICHFIN